MPKITDFLNVSPIVLKVVCKIKSVDFGLEGKYRSGPSKKFGNKELEPFLDIGHPRGKLR